MRDYLLFGLLVAAHGVMAIEPPARIEVFTAMRYPIAAAPAPPVQVYTLDAPAHSEAGLSANLPITLEVAEPLARQALDPHWRAHALALTQAYQGLLKARHYRLAKIPAIVFNERAVVYGVTDVDTAFTYYRRWHEGRR